MKISIIGTAGRKEDGRLMSRRLYHLMVRDAIEVIGWHSAPSDNITLISGGAAWSDHIAVSLFLMRERLLEERGLSITDLHIHLPCKWDDEKFFVGGKEWVQRTARYYHEQFSLKMTGGKSKTATMEGLARARREGAVFFFDLNGFHSRNLSVGKCHLLIAYAWDGGYPPSGRWPKDGGTAHTWRHSTALVKSYRPIEVVGRRGARR